ncbi:MAG TPA: hypothetical protein VMV08_04865 [Gaiellaceae bacterium]|nr:hypothetical protein [Gaiellaceae bacterium]
MNGRRRARRLVLGALGAYCLVSFLFFGLRLLVDPGWQYLGPHDDPQISIWAFAWWPHAILNGQNPFVTPDFWAPSGFNLTWSTSLPGLALAFAPLTLAVGPVAAYDVAAVLMPALTAWTAFLLCRRLTGAAWPSFAGGYLFGFSSYMIAQQSAGHLQLTAVFLVPLAALVVLDGVHGRVGGRGVLLRLGVLLAFQLLISTEVAVTMTLALGVALALSCVLVPTTRGGIRSLLRPLVGAYAFAALLTAPFLYYVFSDFRQTINSPQAYVADLVNIVVPTSVTLAARGWTGWVHLRGNSGENGAFLAFPALVIAALYSWPRRRTAAARFLVASLLVAVFLSLGSELRVDGQGITPLPWLALVHVPVFDNVLPARFTDYAALSLAAIVAIWTASRPARSLLRWVLPLLAMVALLPDLSGSEWSTRYQVPPFFTDSAYRTCLDPGEIVLPLPISDRGDADLWQVASGFRFRLAGGRIVAQPPAAVMHPAAIAQVAEGTLPSPGGPDETKAIAEYIRERQVESVIVDASESGIWAPVLAPIATGQEIGGVLLYNISSLAPSCGGS